MRSLTMRSAKKMCTAANSTTASSASQMILNVDGRRPRAASTHSAPAQPMISGSAKHRLPPRPRIASRMAPMAVPSWGAAKHRYSKSTASPNSATAMTISSGALDPRSRSSNSRRVGFFLAAIEASYTGISARARR